MFIVKKIVVTLCLLGALAVVAVGQAPPAQMNASMTGATQDKKSLYDRLGGYDAIAAVVDDFITRLATDQRFQRFFTGFSNDSKKRLRQHILDQFCAAARGTLRLHGARYEDHAHGAGNYRRRLERG